MANSTFNPAQRLLPLDTIRSLALFGVIVMNTIAVTMVIASKQVLATATTVDMAVGLTNFVLLQGKARACFALLFGIGFGMLLDRVPDRGARFPTFYMRRLAMLFAFGVANQAFLFWGDILAHYAVLGAVLPLCRRWSDRTLLSVGAGLILLPPVWLGFGPLWLGGSLPNLAGAEPSADYARQSAEIYRNGSYAEAMARSMMFQPRAYLYESFQRLQYDLSLLGLFLLGFVAARRKLLTQISANRALLRRAALWCVPIGAPVSLLYLVNVMELAKAPIAVALSKSAFSGPSILALSYVAIAGLWLDRGGERLQRWLAPAGRMALTNYLASGGIASWITYGFGLGLLGTMNLAALTLLGAFIYLMLVLFSQLWLRSFRVGPAEWLLRCVTFGERQPFRRQSARPPAAGSTPASETA